MAGLIAAGAVGNALKTAASAVAPFLPYIACAAVGIAVAEGWEHRPHTPAPFSWVVGQSLGYRLKTVLDADAAAAKVAQAHAAAVDKSVAKFTKDDVAANTVAQTQLRTIYQTIKQEVPYAVPAQADRECSVPNGFVRLHDEAARGDVPGPASTPGISDEATSAFKLSDVADTVVDNYGACNETRQTLIALQGWNRDIYAAQTAPTPAPKP